MKFGSIDHILLFGGGAVLRRIAAYLHGKGIALTVVTSDRHVEELVDGVTLRDDLTNHQIPCICVKSVSKSQAVKRLIQPGTLGLSFGAAWIFRQELIDLFDGRLLNVHGARLPRDRGAGGFSWRILRGESRGACLIHQLVEAVDAGVVVAEELYKFPSACTKPAEFERFQQDRDTEFLKRFISDVLAGKEFSLREQDESIATYFPRLYTPIHGAIDWTWPAQDIVRFISAFDSPYPGAFTFHDQSKVILRDAELANDGEAFHPFMSGLVYRVSDDAIFVAGPDVGIRVRSETVEDPQNLVGHRIWTPSAHLEKARLFRAVYTPSGIKL